MNNFFNLCSFFLIIQDSRNICQLCDNQAWELSLSNGVVLYLGKQDIEKRLLRFCRAYPSVFAERPEQLTSVDLRYARGMAVKWKGLSNVQNQKRI